MRLLALALAILGPLTAIATEPAQTDTRFPFRTDFANESLPWMQLAPGQFPPRLSEHRVRGALASADFIHRRGQFRTDGTGELVDFSLPPFGTLRYLDAEADLRDIPLGTALTFYLYQDEKGAFTKAAVAEDDFSQLAGQGIACRLEEAKLAEGKLSVIKQNLRSADEVRFLQPEPADLGPAELLVNEKTRVWKGAGQIKQTDLAAGDEILYNLTGRTAKGRGVCTEIWVGSDTHRLVAEQQRKKFNSFLRARGLPGWIDGVEGKAITVTLFGDPGGLQALFKDDGIVPAQWAKEHRSVEAVVANEELRTYNPPVDKERSIVKEVRSAPVDVYGCSGERWVIEPKLMLEGFRKGRIVRLFAHPSWPINDMPFGESVYGEVFAAETIETDPNQYPYRTDFANEDLPWYQLKPGEFPPYHSEHRVGGELVRLDALRRSGQFRTDQTGELVDFTMPPFGSVMVLNAEGDVRDLTPGTHYLFFLHQDEKHAFTKASVIMDEYSYLVSERFTYRVEAVKLDEGKLVVAWELPPVRDGGGNMVKPPALGRRELELNDQTHVWKSNGFARLSDLAISDEVLVNLSGRTAVSAGCCTNIWVGKDAHQEVTANQRAKHGAFLKERGLPAWIDSTDGNKLTATIFYGLAHEDFRALIRDDFRSGTRLRLRAADEMLRTSNADADTATAKILDFQRIPAVSYGCSGARLVIDMPSSLEDYQKGRIIRLFAESWPVPAAPPE